MAPPLTTIDGMLRRAAAIKRPGTFLSQAATSTNPSKGWAIDIASVLSAINSRETSEYFIPVCPMARPSQTAIAGKTMGTPPASATPCFTASTILSRFMWPGTMSFLELTTPIRGLPISASQRPSAFRRERCGAALMPWVNGSLRMMIFSPNGVCSVKYLK